MDSSEHDLIRPHAKSLEVFAAGIAHDFNNLLMGVTGNLELTLQELPADSPLRRRLEAALRSAERATDLTKQMLAYCGKGRYVIQPVNLTKLVTEMDLPATVMRRVDGKLPEIQSDPDQTRQIIRNLVMNASEAGATSIVITTGVRRFEADVLRQSRLPAPPAGEFVFVEVADNGSGMSPDTLLHMFDPFFSTKGPSRGLGLSTVLGIVRAHGGAIVAKSQPGQGTAVRVLFPLVQLDPAASCRTVEFMIAPATEKPGADTVLVVDDEEVIRLLCADMVERLGYKSVTAVDGQEGVEIFRHDPRRIACVLLDLTMPRMDGMTALIEMRKIRPDVKVILSTGYDAQEATQRFVGHGLAGYLQKPYRQDALRAMVERVLAAP